MQPKDSRCAKVGSSNEVTRFEVPNSLWIRVATPQPEPTRPRPSAQLQLLTWSGTDQQLLELAHSDAPQAAARLYDRFCRDVNRVIFRLIGPDSDHDDLVQETFLRVLRNIGQVRECEKLGSWVVSVAVNVVLSELKRRKLRRWLYTEKSKVAPTEAYGDDHEARQLLRSVFQVLGSMPAAEQTIFALRHLDERTMPEVAELTGCSVPTAKRSLAKAERRFETLAARLSPNLLGKFSPVSLGGAL